MEEQETGDKYAVRSFMIVIPLGDQFKKNDMEGWEVHVACTWSKPEEKRLFRRPRRRWENNIKMDLKKSWKVVD